jgi:hypothetical protein
MLGHRARIVVENVVCAEKPLEVTGFSIGWQNRKEARAVGIELLRDSGWQLARLWGLA